MHHSTLLFLPTYNESAGVATIIPRLLDRFPTLDILVIDDGSTDGTAQWCEALAMRDARVSVLQRGSKLGLGSANIAAMQYALHDGYQYLASMDADGSHDPNELGRLLDRLEMDTPCDVVIGSRYVGGGRIVDWSFGRRVTSRLVNWYAGTVLGIPVRDCSSGFRCYRTEALTNIDFGVIDGMGYEFYEQILFLLKRQGARFAEVPITFSDRTAGASKASPRIKLQSAWSLLRWGVCRPKHSDTTSLRFGGQSKRAARELGAVEESLGTESRVTEDRATEEGDTTCFTGD